MKQGRKNFSFILFAYEQEHTIKEAVLGALAQDCEPIEILISDDCSSDGTFRVIEETVADYTGPHEIRTNRNTQNLGLNGHIHLMHQMSTGDVIVAASGDDVSLPHRVSRLIELFESEAPLLAHSLASVIGPNGEPAEHDYRSATLFKTTQPLNVACSIALYLGATAAWDKELYRKYGRIEPDAYEDLVFGFRAALEKRIGFIEDELVEYRVGGGITSQITSTMQLNEFRNFRKRQYKVQIAVFKQRQKDCATFGLTANDNICRAIEAAALRAKLRYAYCDGGAREVLRDVWRNPLLALRIIRSERRQARKFTSAPQ